MKYLTVVLLCSICFSSSAFAQDQTPPDSPSTISAEPVPQDWWTPWYLIDYGFVAAGVTMYIVADIVGPRQQAIFGPRFDPEAPEEIFKDESGRIDELFADDQGNETVPIIHAIVIVAGAGVALITEEALNWMLSTKERPSQRVHDTIIGYLEATAITAGSTEFAKNFAGRLRPDFQDRAARHLCNNAPPDGFDCTDYEGRPLDFSDDRAERIFLDGQKSFWSGHSSLAFSTFTYLTLVVGGRWVWGDNATPLSRGLGLAFQGVFLSTAAFVAGSRLDDGRHHVTDVLVGSVAGVGIASFAYWRRFDGNGESIRKKSRLTVGPGPGSGAGLSLTWTP